MKEWLRLALAAMLALGLVLVCMVDIDGDALTQDVPSVVLVAVLVNDKAIDAEDTVDDRDEAPVRARTGLVLLFHRARRRWAAILRRWHRSFVTDAPV